MKELKGVRIDSRGCFKGFNVSARREPEDNQQREFKPERERESKQQENGRNKLYTV